MEKQTHQTLFSDIKYKNAKIDQGLIIAERKSKYELRRNRKPAWAKNLTTNEFISECSPHKKDLTVYVPRNSFKVDDEILVFVNGKSTKMLITKNKGKTFAFEILETRMKTTVTNHTPNNSTKNEA